MGANKKSESRKCGDILIDIKTMKNKAKFFTFHCALCSMDCDQLKKFSKHLENHLHYFENLENPDDCAKEQNCLFEPEEIKVEDIDPIDNIEYKAPSGPITSPVYEDPLETKKSSQSNMKNDDNTEMQMLKNVKNEDNDNNEGESEECTTIKVTYASNVDIPEASNIDGSNKYMNNPYPLILNDFSSDDFANHSSDSDFDVEKELENSKGLEKYGDIKRKSDISKRSQKKAIENNTSKDKNTNKPKRRRRVIIETILPILIQQYRKYNILWEVDDIAFGIKNKKYEIYGKIAETLKAETNKVISLEDINYHINYLNELYAKDKEQDLKCKMEKREFLPEYKHYEELSFLSSSQGPFLCTVCNEILPKYPAYCQHMAEHNETQPFKCPSCDMMFTNYHKYLIHKKRHLGIHDFHCDICGKGYLFKNDLEWHVTSHTGDKPYLCQICGTGFRARHGYDNHIRRHEERFRHECHICKRGFNQLHALNNHVKSHLNIRDVICTICGKGFVHSKYLKRHELIHGKEKRYKCNECGKAFFQSCGLRAHRKNHHS